MKPKKTETMTKGIEAAGIFRAYYNSPVGLLEIKGSADSITALNFVEEGLDSGFRSNKYLENCVGQIDEYFKGTRREFNLNLRPEGSEFQKKVWETLLKVPYGASKSYLWQSKALGDQLAIRAMAKANGENPIAIIIPCHRIIGSDGSLTGYAGGLWRKKWLLEHEANISGAEIQLALNL